MVNKLEQKYRKLVEKIRKLGSVAVAFSGGVDSTFLLKAAYDALGSKAIAVTADSETYPSGELEFSKNIARTIGVKQIIINTDELKDRNFSSNPSNRCYFCKKELFTKMKAITEKNNIKHILFGENLDDIKDFRPGLKAAEEVGVKAPLKDLKFTKEDIRLLSKQLNLPTWDKPSQPCLSSRFPYGEKITDKKLKMVDQAESYLKNLGLRQVRVRIHDSIARIEVSKEDINRFFSSNLSEDVVKKFREIGFNYVTLDLQGYRAGSLNEVLT